LEERGCGFGGGRLFGAGGGRHQQVVAVGVVGEQLHFEVSGFLAWRVQVRRGRRRPAAAAVAVGAEEEVVVLENFVVLETRVGRRGAVGVATALLPATLLVAIAYERGKITAVRIKGLS